MYVTCMFGDDRGCSRAVNLDGCWLQSWGDHCSFLLWWEKIPGWLAFGEVVGVEVSVDDDDDDGGGAGSASGTFGCLIWERDSEGEEMNLGEER